MTLNELAEALHARNAQIITIAPSKVVDGEVMASICLRGGTGWRIERGATAEEAVTRALATVPVLSDSSADVEDVFA